jgi:hypothetical protein
LILTGVRIDTDLPGNFRTNDHRQTRMPRRAEPTSLAVAGGDAPTHAGADACVAPAGWRDATGAMPDPSSSDDFAAPERSEFDGNHSADIALTEGLSLQARAHPAKQASIRNSTPIARPTSARTPVAPTGRALLAIW